jgi:hypothetical protein
MTDIRGRVSQLTYYPQLGEDLARSIRVNPRGDVVVADMFEQAIFDNRVFNASNAVQETLEDISETGRGTANINPALLLDVPSGTTVVPLEVLVDQGLDGTDEDIAFTINPDDGTHYSSGGVQITPISARKDDATSAVSFYSGSSTITASANTDDDTIYSDWHPAESLPKTVGGPTFYWSAKQHFTQALIGPACLKVFVVSASADQTYIWSVKWFELPTVSFSNPA